ILPLLATSSDGVASKNGSCNSKAHEAKSPPARITARRSGQIQMKQPTEIMKPGGKLGVLLVGMGAVATTTIAGVMLARRGEALPIGSLTQLGTIRLGKRTDGRTPLIRDVVPLASLTDIEFGGWDIFPDNAYEAAIRAQVLERHHLDTVREELEGVAPM